MIRQAYQLLLIAAMILLGILIIISIIRSVLGPGISDRIIAVNMIGTIIIMLIAILSLYLGESYLVDVCLIYALISFLGVVVLCKVYTGVYLQKKNLKANLSAVEDNLLHQEEAVVEDIAEGENPADAAAAEEGAARIKAVSGNGRPPSAGGADAGCAGGKGEGPGGAAAAGEDRADGREGSV